jgi:hypothetical protein
MAVTNNRHGFSGSSRIDLTTAGCSELDFGLFYLGSSEKLVAGFWLWQLAE